MKNIIITDSTKKELDDFKKGLEEVMQEQFEVKSFISNWGRTNIWLKIKRYLMYFFSPFLVFCHRKKYSKIIGWQQFYALIFCFYCRLFHVKKTFELYVINFTYKEKKGLIGKIYFLFMKYILTSKYIDMIFVPSIEYINECSKSFNISHELIKTLPFGIPDRYFMYKNGKTKEKYILSIGRSNRDYDWLIKEWKTIDYPLYIISDTYKPELTVQNNVRIIDNVSGDEQFPYIMGCTALIIPILKPGICSGDTVLLTALSFDKNVIVTESSTLAELYIKNEDNGFVVSKEKGKLEYLIKNIIAGKKKLKKNARDSFLKNYSREMMGKRVGDYIK